MHAPARTQRGAAALGATLLLLVVLAIVVGFAGRNAIFEQRSATNQLRETRAFEAADPSQTAGAQVTARQVLTAARPEMELTLADQPELYAELASTIAEAELSLQQGEQKL